MTIKTQVPTTVSIPARRMMPLSAADRTFDLNETCARCGPSTRAGVKWVFPPISEFAHERSDLYLCVHCSYVGVGQLLATSILHVFGTPDQH